MLIGLNPSVLAVLAPGPIPALLAVLFVAEPLLLLGRILVVYGALAPPAIRMWWGMRGVSIGPSECEFRR